MNKNLKKFYFVFFLFCVPKMVIADGLKALEILKKAQQKLIANTMYAELEVTIKRPRWTKTMQLNSWSKGDDYAAVYVASPQKDKGTVYLKTKGEVFNYLPNIKKTIKLPAALLNQSWMGTDLSADDLVKLTQVTTDYNAEITGSQLITGRECYEITLIPKPDSDVLWGKLVVYIDKTDFLQLKTVFYDEDLAVVNTLTASDVRMMNGRKLATKISLKPANRMGYQTRVTYRKIEFNRPIPDSFFTKDNISNIKP